MARQLSHLTKRASGILLHPTSLSNAFAVGDVGPAAYEFIDFLEEAGQHWWQTLPISPIGLGNSPYKSVSTFAGNPLLISPHFLVRDGWLKRSSLKRRTSGSRVNYRLAQVEKARYLRDAFEGYLSRAGVRDRRALQEFVDSQRYWLPDFALFVSLHNRFNGRNWWTWEDDLRKRRPAAMARAQRELKSEIRFQEFVQWQFARQWAELKTYAHHRGVGLIGDLPIFVSEDSADVWAHPDLFMLNPDGSPASVAGVPPDYFSKTGQLWGNPHYRWDVMKKDGYAWWVNRFKTVLGYFDAIRIDHFIGFVRYYAISGHAKNAIHGTYKAGPGARFFQTVLKKLSPDQRHGLIVEDLGKVIPAVKTLRDRFSFPGMKVLQFAFGSDPEALNYQPHNYPRNCVVYTGTHDNNTTLGWFKEEARARPGEAEFALQYLRSDGRELHWDMIAAAEASVGRTVIIPMQDILGLGPAGRMNYPGSARGNWEWRMARGAITQALVSRLRHLCETYQRVE